MRHPTLMLASAAMLGAAVLAGCGDDGDAGVTPTPVPPTRTPVVVLTPDDDIDTGVDIANRVLAAHLLEDPGALVPLLQTQRIACSNEAGVGGPPACSLSPANPPEGTPIDVFPYFTCELEWQFDLDAFAQRWLDATGELFAVVRVSEQASPDALPPEGGYGIIFQPADPAFETAHALIATDNGVVAADSLCGGAAADFLADGPPFHAPEVIFQPQGD